MALRQRWEARLRLERERGPARAVDHRWYEKRYPTVEVESVVDRRALGIQSLQGMYS